MALLVQINSRRPEILEQKNTVTPKLGLHILLNGQVMVV